MTPKQKIARLERWKARHDQLSVSFKSWLDIGMTHDCDLYHQAWTTFDDYTDVLAFLLGDKDEWLAWYAAENQFGLKEMEAKSASMKKKIKVKNFKDLLKLIS